jgi:hypothetical protein
LAFDVLDGVEVRQVNGTATAIVLLDRTTRDT